MQNTRQWTYFLGSILLALLLLWVGGRWLFTPSDRLSSTQLLIFGLVITVGGICLLSLPDIRKNWLPGIIVTAIGFYGCARAAGTISEPWLARLLGLSAWAAAVVILVIAWPRRRQRE
jgi:predicted permease